MSFVPTDKDLVRIKMGLSEEVLRDLWEEWLARNGKSYVRVISGSMQPMFTIDDQILVRKVSAEDIKARDIILFKSKDMLVTHRVVGRFYKNRRLYFIERGDRGGSAGIVPAESVLGKVVAVEKNGRFLRLDSGRGRMVNTVLGINNYMLYRVSAKVEVIKGRLRDKPGFQCMKVFYRISKKPFILLNGGMLRLFTAGMWMGTKFRAQSSKFKAESK